MKFEVNTFNLGTKDEKARKVCEEAVEFYAAHYMHLNKDTEMYELRMEIGDVITALANYCADMGISLQTCIDLAETKNIIRGRYDTIE